MPLLRFRYPVEDRGRRTRRSFVSGGIHKASRQLIHRLSGPADCLIQRIGILLQGEAAEVAAQNITSEQLRSLEGIQEQLVKTAEEDLPRATSLNRQFHFEIMVAADMPMLLATVEATYAMKGPIMKLFSQEQHRQEKFEQIHHDHEAILEGLRTGDGMKARQAMESDIGGCDAVIDWIFERQQATEAA